MTEIKVHIPELPKEVAEAIEFFKTGNGNVGVLTDMKRLASHAEYPNNKNAIAIFNYIHDRIENQTKYFVALSIGYTIEKSPEEIAEELRLEGIRKARAYYRTAGMEHNNAEYNTKEEGIAAGKREAMRALVAYGLIDTTIIE